jgi:hypothetical protein
MCLGEARCTGRGLTDGGPLLTRSNVVTDATTIAIIAAPANSTRAVPDLVKRRSEGLQMTLNALAKDQICEVLLTCR